MWRAPQTSDIIFSLLLSVRLRTSGHGRERRRPASVSLLRMPVETEAGLAFAFLSLSWFDCRTVRTCVSERLGRSVEKKVDITSFLCSVWCLRAYRYLDKLRVFLAVSRDKSSWLGIQPGRRTTRAVDSSRNSQITESR
jgi:hypothetical protein